MPIVHKHAHTHTHTYIEGGGDKTIDVRAINDRREQAGTEQELRQDVPAAGDNVNEFNLHEIRKCPKREYRKIQDTRCRKQDTE